MKSNYQSHSLHLLTKSYDENINCMTISRKNIVFPMISKGNSQTIPCKSSLTNENLSRLSTTGNFNNQSVNLSDEHKTILKPRQLSAYKSIEHKKTIFNLKLIHRYENPFFNIEPTVHFSETVTHKAKQLTFIKKPFILMKSRNFLHNILKKSSQNSLLSTGITHKMKRFIRIEASKELDKKVKNVINRKTTTRIEELNDKVDIDFQFEKLHRVIRNTLIHDINPMNLLEKDSFFQSIENQVNFIEDIFCYPHLQNNFIFQNKNKDNRETILSPYCLSKSTQQSMNKERRKKTFIKDHVNIQNNISTYLNKVLASNEDEYCVDRANYDIEDYFNKCAVYKNIKWASKKEKKACHLISALSNKKQSKIKLMLKSI